MTYTYAEKIKALREEYQLSQNKMGKKVGVAGSNICMAEQGKTKPKISTQEKIIKAFGLSEDYFSDCEVSPVKSAKPVKDSVIISNIKGRYQAKIYEQNDIIAEANRKLELYAEVIKDLEEEVNKA